MTAFRAMLLCSLVLLLGGYARGGQSAAQGTDGSILSGTAGVLRVAQYQLQLMPGQGFVGYWYYWATSGSLSANLKLSPAVSWLSLDSTNFTSTGCSNIKTVLFSFTAPSAPGTYITTVVDNGGRWDTVNVQVLVTATPSSRDSIVLHLAPGATFSRNDTVVWSGWGGVGCVSNFIPTTTPRFEYTTSPAASWLSIQPAGFNASLGTQYVVQRTVTAPASGSVATYEIRTQESSSYPRYIKWKVDVTPVGVDDQAAGKVPGAFALFQNYPSPFNPITTIKYEVPKATHVTLTVYDLFGREVAVLVNERKESGSYTVQFNAGGLASGVYFYRLTAGNFVDTKKLILLR